VYTAHIERCWLQAVMKGKIIIHEDDKEFFWPGDLTADSTQVLVLGHAPSCERIAEESRSLPSFDSLNTGKEHNATIGEEAFALVINALLKPFKVFFQHHCELEQMDKDMEEKDKKEERE
jgi:hypothetical protein